MTTGDAFRIDPTADRTLPQCVSVSSAPTVRAVYEFGGKPINPLECSGVLCRFALESLAASSDDPLTNFTQSESLTAFLAPLRMIDSSRWINDPWVESRADCKILQAQAAERLGLKIPDFIISSNYDDILAFYKEHGKGAQIDFRLNNNEVIRKYELPGDIAEKLARLVHELDVRFASCDLALSEDGDIYFLEANVQGNWLWTEQGATLPISRAIADALDAP